MSDEIPILLPQSARIELYIIAHHGCQTADLAREINSGLNTANTIAMRLREKGKVTRYYVDGEKRPRWKAGREDGIYIYEPRMRGKYKPRAESADATRETNRRFVTQWEPCTLRDPLVDLFFGRQ